jgi:hypothetical protein
LLYGLYVDGDVPGSPIVMRMGEDKIKEEEEVGRQGEVEYA